MEKIENYINLAQKIDNVIYSNSFYPISQIKKIQKLYHKEIDLVFKGLNEGSEKNILAFFPKNYSKEYINFPIKFFKILKKSKFISLEHKNYLGSILAMGLKREILGDLLVKDEVCYGIIVESMFDFLKENLLRISSSPVEIIEISEEEIPKNEFKDISITVASVRLDSLVAELTNLSRTAAVNYIELGNVQINYDIEKEKSCRFSVGDVLILKKYGKFIVSEEKGFTKKDKIKFLIKKYI